MRIPHVAVGICLCMLLVSPTLGALLTPVQDGEVIRDYDDNDNTYPSAVSGQWWPRVNWYSGPEWESQVVLEFDLSSVTGELFGQATFGFYVGQAFNIDALRLDVCGYYGDGVVDAADWEAGSVTGTFSADNPSPGTPSWAINTFALADVTSLVNNRPGDTLTFNVRLAGDRPDYDGNVFQATHDHFVDIAASENLEQFRPFLDLVVPEPSTLAILTMGIWSVLLRRRTS